MIDWSNFNPTEPFTLPLASSCLTSLSYNPLEETLTLDFTDGTQYEYWDVPLPIVLRLAQAPSVGRFFNAVIRDSYQNFQV